MDRQGVWQGSRRGISLVEILIILACIAILAAILFPIFSSIREAAFRTKCASNMQQLARAFQTYAQDWSGYWPNPGGRAGDYAYWHQTGTGGLTQYVRQKGYKSIWCCPKMPQWPSYYDARSYSMNSYLRSNSDVEYPTCCNLDRSLMTGICVANIPQTDKTILLFEGLPLTPDWLAFPPLSPTGAYYVYIYRCCNWTGVKGYYPKLAYTIDPAHPWHRRVNNYIYCDGHLATRQPGRKTIGELSTHKEMYDWYVDKDRFEAKLWPGWAKLGCPYE